MPTLTANPAPITLKTDDIAMPVFTGRYAKQQETLFTQSIKVFRLTPAQAELFAKHAALDAATALKSVNANFTVGKANEDGKATIADAAKQKGVSLTNSLNLVRALQWAADAGKNNISWGATRWELNEKLTEYVAGLGVK